MKRLENVSPVSGKVALPLKYLVVAMAAMISLPLAQADVAGKKIGDLEIYKAAEGGKTTITMMLDTSGSMTINQVDYACDLPSTVSFDRSMVGSEPSMTSPSYPRMYCEVKGEKRYFYRNYSGIFGNIWYICESSNGLGVTNRETCNTVIDKPSVNGYESEVGGLFNTSTYSILSSMGEQFCKPKKIAVLFSCLALSISLELNP